MNGCVNVYCWSAPRTSFFFYSIQFFIVDVMVLFLLLFCCKKFLKFRNPSWPSKNAGQDRTGQKSNALAFLAPKCHDLNVTVCSPTSHPLWRQSVSIKQDFLKTGWKRNLTWEPVLRRVRWGDVIFEQRAEDAASTTRPSVLKWPMATCDVTRYRTSCGGGQGYEALVLCGV